MVEYKGVVGINPAMTAVLTKVQSIAASKTPVLIQGESGTGKELIALAIHESSNRANRPFLALNCSAIAEGLVESELFGHKRGAFTGATDDRAGKLETANGGTVFLDEIAEIPLSLQVKLLRVLQFGEIQRVGEDSLRHVDVRIVAASNANLKDLVKSGRFREDLYYRIKVVEVVLPPLRHRREDIPILVEFFISKANQEHSKTVSSLAPDVMRHLLCYDFPGNIRELESAISQAVLLCRGDRITRADLPPEIRSASSRIDSNPPPRTYTEFIRVAHAQKAESERKFLTRLLSSTDGNVSRAAEAAGINRTHLHRLLRRHHLTSLTSSQTKDPPLVPLFEDDSPPAEKPES
ncbi:MAG: sigma-54 dependent transcriptional regulator [Planctomycetota bacterium]|nr:sigma-54 dependent transcriptional regulator [Planctomycetota bacterium]